MLFKRNKQAGVFTSNINSNSTTSGGERTIKRVHSARNLFKKLTISTPVSLAEQRNERNDHLVYHHNQNHYLPHTPDTGSFNQHSRNNSNNNSSSNNNNNNNYNNNQYTDVRTAGTNIFSTPSQPSLPLTDNSSIIPPSEPIPDINDFENDSIFALYTPRKPVIANNQLPRMDSQCASLLDQLDGPPLTSTSSHVSHISKVSCNSHNFHNFHNSHNSDHYAGSATSNQPITMCEGEISTSTSLEHTPTKDTDAISITDANIQIYKRAHVKSKSNSLHLIEGAFKVNANGSPVRLVKKSTTTHITSIPNSKSEKLKEVRKDTTENKIVITPVDAEPVESLDANLESIYQFEMMLLKDKHHYELKQQQREIRNLRKKLQQQTLLCHDLTNRLASYESVNPSPSYSYPYPSSSSVSPLPPPPPPPAQQQQQLSRTAPPSLVVVSSSQLLPPFKLEKPKSGYASSISSQDSLMSFNGTGLKAT
ncbi:hypothetical protein PVL30_004172 [Lodderomyces elongisporus]|uniref:uncharacterized protein n=1 Tax=Lodderomyces elongisporus TaxID=36914 RepID=UPI002920D68F|nr:uncharacterized protein PVL30_004172 [Lodderomyces elongisporus]WLF80395.1 hypothetical protein PVL30_004172 [Lodderomyces elongisporus]